MTFLLPDISAYLYEVIDDALFIKTFIMTHSMRLAIFNEFSTLKLLSVADTRFASMIVMLKRLKLLKSSLQNMVISDQWNSYREDDVGKFARVKEIILNDIWWDKVDYILSFIDPIYSTIRKRNKMDPKRAEDLVCVHSNLRHLSRKSEFIKKERQDCMSLDEPDLEAFFFG
uniref:Uncharacterized protein n=1 Tax=Cajanus cajan TaxID=3821 RepID=A0A151QZN7_CAJCA|nr:hypothetical protein KK1_043272 [Cajanus cajan]